jgi:hypothetical protein
MFPIRSILRTENTEIGLIISFDITLTISINGRQTLIKFAQNWIRGDKILPSVAASIKIL